MSRARGLYRAENRRAARVAERRHVRFMPLTKAADEGVKYRVPSERIEPRIAGRLQVAAIACLAGPGEFLINGRGGLSHLDIGKDRATIGGRLEESRDTISANTALGRFLAGTLE
jgi:hypothetical protein